MWSRMGPMSRLVGGTPNVDEIFGGGGVGVTCESWAWEAHKEGPQEEGWGCGEVWCGE